MSRNKNVSKKIRNGTTMQTRDEYFEGQGDYRKPGYEGKGNYRRVVVIDSNDENEVAVVALTTSSRGERLPDYKQGNSRFRPFVKTKDNEGKPIRQGRKYVRNGPKHNVSKKDVARIKKICFREGPRETTKANRRRVRRIKKRK